MLLAWLSTALAATATFDALPEGRVSHGFTEDGITVGPLDDGISPGSGTLNTEAAQGTLGGLPGFTPDNVLGFGGYAPGDGAAFGRLVSLRLEGPAGADHAEVHVFSLGNPSASVRLEAVRGGSVVNADQGALAGWGGVGALTLEVDGEPFDHLMLRAVGADAVFVAIDTVVILGGDPVEPADTAATDTGRVDDTDPEPTATDTGLDKGVEPGPADETDASSPAEPDPLDPRDGAGTPEDGPSCGCTTGGAPSALPPLALLLSLAARRRAARRA